NLYRNLNRNLYLYRNLNLNLDLNRNLNLNLNLNLELAEEEDPQLYVALSKLKQRLPDEENTSYKEFKQWWQDNGKVWSADFRQAMIDYRDIGYNWQFSDEQKALLEQYYVANQLLTQCLHQDCYVRPEVRQEIEETLLLPYADVAKRRGNIRCFDS
ncbi:MAG: signal transduction protein, partial [Cyanobacteria bacterium J06631_6]